MVGDDYILTKSDTCKVCPPPMCKSRGLLYKSIVNQETFAPDGTFGNV